MSDIEINEESKIQELVKTTGVGNTYVDRLRAFRRLNRPLLILGAPGIGKSQICEQAADGDPLHDVRLSMMESIDLRGLPIPGRDEMLQEDVVKWAKPDFLPSSGSGILLFDELNTADVSVMNAALQIILNRRCGPHRLGDGWWIVACGNKASHKANVNPMPAPLRNRFTIFEMEPDFNQWRNWAITKGDVHADVVGFLSSVSGQHLYNDPTDEYGNFATPRAWAALSDLLKGGINDRESIEGTVGRGAAGWFIEYRKASKDMPDIDKLLEGTVSYQDAPNRLALTYAVVSNLLYRTIKKLSILDKAAGVLVRSEIRPEIATLFFAGILANSRQDSRIVSAMIKSKNYNQWISKHSDLITKYGA